METSRRSSLYRHTSNYIWHTRNTKTFEGKFIPVRKSVDWIKEDAFIWVFS
ncbi:hypothetical protein HanRHA438_Chr02g0093031 [Helianthus annuus]|nr:hypothetical protein HanRHA438_Chr02g0093031 [Helianthus annuus]